MRIIYLMLVLLGLSACTEVQFASHVFKNAENTPDYAPRQEGNFKVGKPYKVLGTTYYPKESYDLVETGIASWYGPGFHGGHTASGEKFDSSELTAAHRTLQMPSLVRVTNLDNGRSIIVRVNDRGPFARGRVMDVSSRAADLLAFKGRGTAKVKIEVLPKESLRIAEMARRGENIKGIELAANEGRFAIAPPGAPMQVVALDPSQPLGTPVALVSAEALATSLPLPLHESADGRVMPDPVVTQLPVHPTSIYVQAGSFGVRENAEKMRQRLSGLGAPTNVQPATVSGRQFYRVRVGPIPNVQSADKLLNRVIGMGNDKAVIVVD